MEERGLDRERDWLRKKVKRQTENDKESKKANRENEQAREKVKMQTERMKQNVYKREWKQIL